jgi:hypothetical protein
MANLILIAKNEQPKREERYPQIWLLYKGHDTIQIHVTHDGLDRPRVLDKGAA